MLAKEYLASREKIGFAKIITFWDKLIFFTCDKFNSPSCSSISPNF